jgi:hypothetical protein
MIHDITGTKNGIQGMNSALDYDGVRLTSQNRGNQQAYRSSPRWYVSMESRGDGDAGWG